MPPRRLTPEAEARIVKDYSAGIRVLDIAEQEGIAGGTIYSVLRSHGIEPGRHQRKRRTSSENNRLRAALRLALERLDAADAAEVRRIAGEPDPGDQSVP